MTDKEKKKPGRKLQERKEAPLPVRNTRGQVPKIIPEDINNKLNPVFKFNPKHLKFLDVYSETLDFSYACKESGLRRENILKNRHLAKEVEFINNMAALKYRNKVALATHQRLMEKFEDCHDSADDPKVAANYASTVARMSDANLRAAGEFHDHGTPKVGNAVQVVINIGEEKSDKPDCVEVKAEPLQTVREDDEREDTD